tara:strand:- start:545 stop:952 length:408 start_codon:yes stop_codon:yes gene_type:complete
MSNKYTLDELFDEAKNQVNSVKNTLPLGECIISKGVKIQKFSDHIEILNMSKGGSYYAQCTPREYLFFIKDGWNIGCVKLSIENCLYKLSLIEEKIKNEVNTRKNDKHIQNLKNKRDSVLHKYSTLQLKLKSIIN